MNRNQQKRTEKQHRKLAKSKIVSLGRLIKLTKPQQSVMIMKENTNSQYQFSIDYYRLLPG
jgi:hypothetical protein